MLIWSVIIVNVFIILMFVYFRSKVKFFFKSFHHRHEQQSKCICLVQLNNFFLQFNWFHIFYALIFILQYTLTVFSLSVHSQFLLWIHTLCCWKIFGVNVVSQVVTFILIQLFWLLHINTKKSLSHDRLLSLMS